MARSSQKGKKRVDVSVQHEFSLNLLSNEIWSSIATMVASNFIQDLFNMHATCKVFLGAASSDVVYEHAKMSYKTLPCFLLHLDGPERRFLDRCVEVGNVDAIVRHGLAEFLRFGRRHKGMELLARASAEGSIEATYLCSMLLMFDPDDEEDVRTDVQMLEAFRVSGQLESYTNFITDLCNDNNVLSKEMFARI